MNPFQAIMGNVMPQQPVQAAPAAPVAGGPMGSIQAVMQRFQQLAQGFRNPQAMVQQVFPDAPAEVRNDPDQLLQWMQLTGKVNPQTIQMAQKMMGGR